MNGLNKTITLSFMIVGHTKFMPDSCFGLLKQKMRRTNIECLDDIVQTINKSANVNHTQLVGTQNGEVLVPTYDWLSFFAMYFKKISNIKSYQNFIVSTNSPGVVEYKKFSNSESTKINIIKDSLVLPTTGELPQILAPSGLSSDRQWYLHDKIRPFCSERTQDLTCPLPSVPKSTRANTPTQTPIASPMRPTMTDTLPPTKIPRICGKCGLSGHNRRSCK